MATVNVRVSRSSVEHLVEAIAKRVEEPAFVNRNRAEARATALSLARTIVSDVLAAINRPGKMVAPATVEV